MQIIISYWDWVYDDIKSQEFAEKFQKRSYADVGEANFTPYNLFNYYTLSKYKWVSK